MQDAPADRQRASSASIAVRTSGESGPVQWNFEKFLVDGDGAVVARFRPTTDPGAPEVRTAIEALLPR